jgi:hypothetical protein
MPLDVRHPSTQELGMLTVEFGLNPGTLLHSLDLAIPGVLLHPPRTSRNIVVEPAAVSVRVADVAVDISLVLESCISLCSSLAEITKRHTCSSKSVAPPGPKSKMSSIVLWIPARSDGYVGYIG